MTFKDPFQTNSIILWFPAYLWQPELPCVSQILTHTCTLLSKGHICFMLSAYPLQETAFIQGIFFLHEFLWVCDRENETAEACLEFSLEDDERKGKFPLLQYQDYSNFSRRVFYFVLSLDRWCWNTSKQTNQKLSHIKELNSFTLGQFHLKLHWWEDISKLSY